MTVDDFWSTIDDVKSQSAHQSDRAEQLAIVLQRDSADQVQKFFRLYLERIDEAYSWELWGAAYVMMGGCSDDGFDYFRDWLISEGRRTYENAVANPESLAQLGRLEAFPELEEFRYVALAVYEEKTGKPMEDRPFNGSFEPTGTSWDEDQVHLNYPQHCAMYLENPLE